MWSLIITLIAIGILLLAAELIIIPGFGIAGILGLVSLIASCIFAFGSFGTTAGAIVVGVNILLVIISTLMVLRSRTWKKVSLNTAIDAKVDNTPQTKGIGTGQFAKTITRMAPGGQIKTESGVVTEAFTRDSIIEAQRKVVITEIEGNRIFVKEF